MTLRTWALYTVATPFEFLLQVIFATSNFARYLWPGVCLELAGGGGFSKSLNCWKTKAEKGDNNFNNPFTPFVAFFYFNL